MVTGAPQTLEDRLHQFPHLALLLDRAVQAPVFIASAEGGTEIEEVGVRRPVNTPVAELGVGEVGYVITNIRNLGGGMNAGTCDGDGRKAPIDNLLPDTATVISSGRIISVPKTR